MVKGCSPPGCSRTSRPPSSGLSIAARCADPHTTPIWSLNEDRFLFAFAGLWTPWRGERESKGAPDDGGHDMSGVLTTDANAIAAPIDLKALPVILTNPAGFDRGLAAETSDGLALQQPLAEGAPRFVGRGERSHGSVTAA